ncbi:hypothetical protein L2E82_24487 [Cichorium intybus]|uniref:Uncharacterized protein n=1 Tax=Cichorium intybus TaxID=13427 RepID=A0ACB9E0C1_CICIN|nr:hypothetical protein L2E82_24487 [Cichorium intybus]
MLMGDYMVFINVIPSIFHVLNASSIKSFGNVHHVGFNHYTHTQEVKYLNFYIIVLRFNFTISSSSSSTSSGVGYNK